jgi:hypothetical protein
VWRSTDAVNYERLMWHTITATTYADTPPSARTYWYGVSANNSAGQSEYAVVEVSVCEPDVTLPTTDHP